ncbi:PASTA domain-containing protein [Mycolicibacterium palauense]|uniref:PASTA domain-containing protein n=1 Tax=Mycolicibacterium palauense TaxID=2034511 RepID=UPI001145D66C|nr:PASTA domain-containing protein [Mycolicibacterium palauense]
MVGESMRRGRLVLAALVIVGGAGGCSNDGPPPVDATAPPPTSSSPSPVPHPLVVPDLVCTYWTDAEPRLRELGWTGVLVKGPDVTDSECLRHQAAVQDPPPGQTILSDASITLRFAA